MNFITYCNWIYRKKTNPKRSDASIPANFGGSLFHFLVRNKRDRSIHRVACSVMGSVQLHAKCEPVSKFAKRNENRCMRDSIIPLASRPLVIKKRRRLLPIEPHRVA